MHIFHQLQVGRHQLFHAAVPKLLGAVEDAWRSNQLGQIFTVRPMLDHVIGEEIIDSDGSIIAVFGVAATNAFVPDPTQQKNSLEKLSQVIKEMQ